MECYLAARVPVSRPGIEPEPSASQAKIISIRLPFINSTSFYYGNVEADVYFAGICKEKLAADNGNAAVHDEAYECYEQAGSICIRYLQEMEHGLPESLLPIGIPKSVDTAIKRQVIGSLQQKFVSLVLFL